LITSAALWDSEQFRVKTVKCLQPVSLSKVEQNVSLCGAQVGEKTLATSILCSPLGNYSEREVEGVAEDAYLPWNAPRWSL